MTMPSNEDPLSSVLRSIHLSGGVYFRCEFSAPWGLEVPENPDAEFHVVVSGECWVAPMEGNEATSLVAGDIAVFLDGARHRLLDTPRGKALAPERVIGDPSAVKLGPVEFGGGGAPVTILCGYFRFDRDNTHPVLRALPSFIHLKGATSYGAAAIVDLMHQETLHDSPGREAALDRLSELLFIQILRTHINAAQDRTGILAALRDRKIGAALGCMHGSPQVTWTLDHLARELGMSRSAFAARFSELVGQAPMHYLTAIRLVEAKRLLRESKMSTLAIAERIGYGSEAALGKAFKRLVGMGPGEYRRQSDR